MRVFSGALVVLAALPLAASVSAQQWAAEIDRDTAFLALVSEALDGNPSLAARRAALDAARHRIRPAGALPDPMLRVGFMDPLEMAHNFTQIRFNLEQEFPWPGTLGARADLARAGRATAEATLDASRRELIVAVGAAYYRLQYMTAVLDIVQRQRRLLDAAVQTSTARYATGVAPQSDPLQARLARDRLEAEEANLVGDLRAVRAAVNALRNRVPDAPVDARPLDAARLRSQMAPLEPQEALVARAARVHPRVAARRAGLAQARQAIRLERLAARPDVTLMLEYDYLGRVPPRPSIPDFASLFVGLRLPVWAWRKQLRLADAARADSAAAAAELQDVEAELARDVAATWARAAAGQRRLELLVDGVLPTARATVESAVRGYEVGRIEFVTVIAVEDALFRAEIEAAAVAAEYQLQLLMLQQLTTEEERP